MERPSSCEKPLAIDVAECEKMVAAVKKARVVNMVCHNYRRIPAIAQARRMIERGDLGDRIYHVRARYAQDWIADPNFPACLAACRRSFPVPGTNGDINSHIIDMARFVVGEINEVCGLLETFVRGDRSSRGGWQGVLLPRPGKKSGKVTVDDAVSWIGRFKNGASRILKPPASRMVARTTSRSRSTEQGFALLQCRGYESPAVFNLDDPEDARGFRDILVTETCSSLRLGLVAAWAHHRL